MAVFNNLFIILLINLLSFNLESITVASPIPKATSTNSQSDKTSVRSSVIDYKQHTNQKNQLIQQIKNRTQPSTKADNLNSVTTISTSVHQKGAQKNRNKFVIVIAIIGSLLSFIVGLLVIACVRYRIGHRLEVPLNERLKQMDDDQFISVWNGDLGADIETVPWKDLRESLSAVDTKLNSRQASFQDSLY